MKQDQSSFRIERRLTPALFDHYVAKARAERGKAIAAFVGVVAASLGGLAGRIRDVVAGQRARMPGSGAVR